MIMIVIFMMDERENAHSRLLQYLLFSL